MVDFISPTASLLESNTKATTAKLDRQATRGAASEALLQKSADTAAEQSGATGREVLKSKQAQFLQNLQNQAAMALETMQQQEASKRQEKQLTAAADLQHQQDYFTMTPNVVKGIKTTLDMDFKDLEGKEVNAPLILAMISAKYKTDIANTAADAKKLAGSRPADLQKELDKIENDIKSNRDKLFAMSVKDLPPEVWTGGKPGDMKTLIQNVSGGRLGKLSPEAQSQVQMVAGYINTMKSKQERANKIHEQLSTTKTDYTGFGLDNAAATEFKTADDVKAAYRAGQLSREKAKQILADQFQLK